MTESRQIQKENQLGLLTDPDGLHTKDSDWSAEANPEVRMLLPDVPHYLGVCGRRQLVL